MASSSSSSVPDELRPAQSQHAAPQSKDEGVDRILALMEEDGSADEKPQPKVKAKGRPRKDPTQVQAEEGKSPAKRVPKLKEEGSASKPPRKQARTAEAASTQEAAEDGVPWNWGEDPTDPRLAAEGAVCDEDARLMLASYKDLKSSFSGEPRPEKHPDPARPGLRREELPGGSQEVSLEHLKSWQDAKGEGWIATRMGAKNESRWISARTWGSWRLAFLMATVQRDVWKAKATAKTAASDAPASGGVPSEDTSSSFTAESKPQKRVLSGRDEWLAFSPPEMDLTLCKARSWNQGLGGQCTEKKPRGFDLCLKHQKQAIGVQGLRYGFVDGPIPDARLAEFQQAAVRIAMGQTVPDRDKVSRQVDRKKRRSKKEKSKKVKKDSGGKSKKVKKEKRSISAGRKSKIMMKNIKIKRWMHETFPGQKPLQPERPEGARGRGRPRTSEETSSSVPSEPEGVLSQPGAGLRRRRDLKTNSKLDHKEAELNFWNRVDSAMDDALAQQEKDNGPGVLRKLLDEHGNIRESDIAKVVELMGKVESSDARLSYALVLRRSVQADKVKAATFVIAGGVEAVRPWLQAALPQRDAALAASSEEDMRRREMVVLECLELLRQLPVTLTTLKTSDIGRTLTALRGYCKPAMAAAGELMTLWQNKFRDALQDEAKQKLNSDKSQPSTSSSGQPSASSSSSGTKPVPPWRQPQPPPTPKTAAPKPAAAPTIPQASSARQPAVARPQKRTLLPSKIAWRRRQTQAAGSDLEATLRELFILGEVLGDTEPDQAPSDKAQGKAVEIDLCDGEDVD